MVSDKYKKEINKTILYLKAVAKFEEENDSLNMLLIYLNNYRHPLPKLYCKGEAFLPSPELLRKLQDKFSNLSQNDQNLNHLFEEALKHSKIFYTLLIELIIRAQSKTINFDQEFEKTIQPVGQKLINYLKSIKYRILFIETNNQQIIHKQNFSKRNYLTIFGFINFFIKTIPEYIYKACLIQTTHHNIIKIFYCVFSLINIIFAWFISFQLSQRFALLIPPYIIASLAAVFMGLIAIIAYPGGDFEKIDIYGKNLIAYNYKSYINTLVNTNQLIKKIHSINLTKHKNSLS